MYPVQGAEAVMFSEKLYALNELRQWIINLNEQLSAEDVNFDVILSQLHSHTGILYEIRETKEVVPSYLRALTAVARAAKAVRQELEYVDSNKKLVIIAAGDWRMELIYLPDGTFYTLTDVQNIMDMYRTLVEIFKTIARRTAYTILAGIEAEEQRVTEAAYQQPAPPQVPPSPYGGGVR